MTTDKEFLYVGYYIDVNNNYILKVGTTGNLDDRRKQHTRNYKTASTCAMPPEGEFHYLWHCPLSKYNTLRYEDRTRDAWKAAKIGEFVRNDRFILTTIPDYVEVTIKKTYRIALSE